MTLLSIHGLQKTFGNNRILKGVDLDVDSGEIVSIIGASGSGKTTLLRCVNLLEEFDGGEIILEGTSIGYVTQNGKRLRRPERELARQRAMTGMVFQSFNLFPHLTALGNVTLGLTKVRGLGRSEANDTAMSWLDRVGLADRAGHYPSQLSGGQQQRVAIARALATDPAILLADEPTGNLDSKTGDDIMALFHELHRAGDTIVLITHNEEIAKQAQRRIRIMDGKVSEVDA